MALTAKERMARWRQKQRDNPELYERYKQKERERYMRKKESGIVVPISEMSEREQRKTRRIWRRNAQSHRRRRKELQSILTPPNSPAQPEIAQPNLQPYRSSSMRRSHMRKRKRGASKCYRNNAKLVVKLKAMERLTERYKKRFHRLRKKLDFDQTDDCMVQQQHKCFLLFKVLVNNIRRHYMNSKSNEEKQKMGSLISSHQVLRKYGLGAFARSVLGISRRHLKVKKPRPISVKKLRMKKKVEEFFETDDNSKIKADKQATITRKGMKKQIRLLTDDLKNLHTKYVSDGNKISYSLFCRLRPFWVLRPTEKDRQTCLCKIHDNLRLKLNTAYAANMYEAKDVNMLVKRIVCTENSKECMYKECLECRNKKITFNDGGNEGDQLTWMMWKNRRIERKDANGKLKVVSMVVKEKEQGTKKTLNDEIEKELIRAGRHIFNIRHQYKSLRYLREKMTHEELVMHIDFSENYCCKYSSEIQSMHFGASRRQISLHTGVAYMGNTIIPFCTVSDCLQHGPPAIWAHLDPVIRYLQSVRSCSAIHFITDGPTTQYRNKLNFYLWSHKVFYYGFSKSTWNFLEAGHGKGAAEEIGAAIKRNADSQENGKGSDIACAKDFVETLLKTASKVQLFCR